MHHNNSKRTGIHINNIFVSKAMVDVSFKILIKDHMIKINFLYEVGVIFIFCHVTYNIGGKFEEINC